jgi:hypothetical protein
VNPAILLAEKPDYVIRYYTPGDEDKIVKLLIDVFGRWPGFDIECSAADHWKWKFIDNPASKDICLIVVAEINGDIVGVTHGMPFYIKIGEGKHLSEKEADSAVKSIHRGKGIYSKLGISLNNISDGAGYEFLYWLSDNPIFVTQARRDRHNESLFPQPLKSLIKINDVDKHFKHTVKDKTLLEKTLLRTGVRGLKTVSKLANLSSKTPQLKDVTFREITRFDDRIDAFYEKIKPHYNFIVERTVDHMNWRYCDKRGGDYKVWIAEKGDEVVGYLVLRVNRIDADYPEGHIMDLLALNDRGDVAENFTKFAVDYFDGLEVNVVHAQIIGGYPYERVLGKYGLLDTMVKPNLVYKAINASVLGGDLERFVKSPPAMLHYALGEGDSI